MLSARILPGGLISVAQEFTLSCLLPSASALPRVMLGLFFPVFLLLHLSRWFCVLQGHG